MQFILKLPGTSIVVNVKYQGELLPHLNKVVTVYYKNLHLDN